MRLITTKLPATGTKGARIGVTIIDGHATKNPITGRHLRRTFPYDYALQYGENHAAAARSAALGYLSEWGWPDGRRPLDFGLAHVERLVGVYSSADGMRMAWATETECWTTSPATRAVQTVVSWH